MFSARCGWPQRQIAGHGVPMQQVGDEPRRSEPVAYFPGMEPRRGDDGAVPRYRRAVLPGRLVGKPRRRSDRMNGTEMDGTNGGVA